jgi:dephospho-CoA kinase
MFKLGITGGIGAGKSTAVKYFSQKGAFVFDADVEGKNHLKNSISLQQRLIKTFGNEITSKKHKIDFHKLANIAFSDSINQKILNGIVWPEIYLIMSKSMNKQLKKGCKLFIVDAALMFESKFNSLFDHILLVTADKNIRIDRVLNRGNVSLDQINKRIALQMPETEKEKLADYTIVNNGEIDDFYQQLDLYFNQLNI